MRYGKLNHRLIPLLMLLVANLTLAQSPTYGLGRTPSEEEIQAWDISVGLEGKELPPGSATAREGANIYAQKCAMCHGPTGAESMYPGGYPPALVGGIGTIATENPVRTIGSYWPFATSIWDYINRAMPPNPMPMPPNWNYALPVDLEARERLEANEVYAVTAFLLYRNGIIKEDEVLDARSLPTIKMPNRNGFLPIEPGNWKPGMQYEPHIIRR
jgi:mono/diheme cytochrome c family protein